jgi:hypothetical protein
MNSLFLSFQGVQPQSNQEGNTNAAQARKAAKLCMSFN